METCSESNVCKITVTKYIYKEDMATVLVYFIKGEQYVILVMKLRFMYCGRSGYKDIYHLHMRFYQLGNLLNISYITLTN